MLRNQRPRLDARIHGSSMPGDGLLVLQQVDQRSYHADEKFISAVCWNDFVDPTHLMLDTDHPLATAALHTADPRSIANVSPRHLDPNQRLTHRGTHFHLLLEAFA